MSARDFRPWAGGTRRGTVQRPREVVQQPLTVQDVPVPEPGPGQVLVRIEVTGLCHTDIHAAHGDWPVTPSLP